jgi:AraC-like DNA-binding protein
MLEEIVYLSASASALNRAKAAAILVQFLIEWAGCGPHANTERAAQIDAAITFIERNPSLNPSMDELAQKVNLTRSTFARRFRAATGKSAKEFILDLKVRLALSIFTTNPAAKIRDVAWTLGFADEFYFSRLFKVKTGLSPRQSRDRLPI